VYIIFLIMNAGMANVLRPSLYGAVHPITILPGSGDSADVGDESESFVVVGHCCESGDLMTPLPGEPESLGERESRKAELGMLSSWMVVSGAYCTGLSKKNNNSFPEAPEVLVDSEGGGGGELEIWVNECAQKLCKPSGLF
jgi:diaminopimelate decarboxylase